MRGGGGNHWFGSDKSLGNGQAESILGQSD